MAKGSCACGAVTYEAEIKPTVTKCHCSICRKTSGASYMDFVIAPIDNFVYTSGEDKLSRYESTPGNFRPFCSVCGAHMPSSHESMGIAFIPAGTLDTDEDLVETTHMFVGSRVKWHPLQPGLEEFDTYPE